MAKPVDIETLMARLRDSADRIIGGETIFSDRVHGDLLIAADALAALEARCREMEGERDRLKDKVDEFANGDTFLVLRDEDREKAACELTDDALVKWARWALVVASKYTDADVQRRDRSVMEVMSLHAVTTLARLVRRLNADHASFVVEGASWIDEPDGGDWQVTIERVERATAALQRSAEAMRERCAKVAEDWASQQGALFRPLLMTAVDRIRALPIPDAMEGV